MLYFTIRGTIQTQLHRTPFLSMILKDNILSFFLSSSTKSLLTSCTTSILLFLLPMAKNTLLFICSWFRYFTFSLNINLSLCEAFFIPLFLLYNPKFIVHDIFGNLLLSACLIHLFFRNWDIKWRSYEHFYLFKSLYTCLAFFYFLTPLKTPLILSLQVPSFFDCHTTRFILGHLSI